MDPDLVPWTFHGDDQSHDLYVTPYRVALALLVNEHSNLAILSEQNANPHDRRKLSIAILHLLQYSHMPCSELVAQVKEAAPNNTLVAFEEKLRSISLDSPSCFNNIIADIQNFFSDVVSLSGRIQRWSIIGIFLRRLSLAIERLSFSGIAHLHQNLVDYITEGRSAEVLENEPRVISSGAFLSREAALLLSNPQKALPPQELENAIQSLLAADGNMVEAYYLRYLNSLSVSEYCAALDSIHAHFDQRRTWNDLGKNLRYASLHLAMLHAKFGHKKEAIRALEETISLAQDGNDNVCLQQALAWLAKLKASADNGDEAVSLGKAYTEASLQKSNELALWPLYALGAQTMTRLKALSGTKPTEVLSLVRANQDLNQRAICLLSRVDEATAETALWTVYGFTRMALLMAQKVAHMAMLARSDQQGVPNGGADKDIGVPAPIIGENVSLALCSIAQYVVLRSESSTEAEAILEFGSTLYSPNDSAHRAFDCAKLLCQLEVSLRSEAYESALSTAEGIGLLRPIEGAYQRARVHLLRGAPSEALDAIHALKDKTKRSRDVFLEARLQLLFVQALREVDMSAQAVTAALRGLSFTSSYHQRLLHALFIVEMAHLELDMSMEDCAVKRVLDTTTVVHILAHGTPENRAQLQLLRAQIDSLKADTLGRVALREFNTLRHFRGVRDTALFLAKHFHRCGLVCERNEMARVHCVAAASS